MRREGEERGWEKGGGEVGREEDREVEGGREIAAKSWEEQESPKEVKGRGRRVRWGEGSRQGLGGGEQNRVGEDTGWALISACFLLTLASVSSPVQWE